MFQYKWASLYLSRSQDDKEPLAFNVQGITTFPAFTLSSQGDILSRLGLGPSDSLQRFNLATRTWCYENASTIVMVRSREHLLFRLDGVSTCLKLDEICDITLGSKAPHWRYAGRTVPSHTSYIDPRLQAPPILAPTQASLTGLPPSNTRSTWSMSSLVSAASQMSIVSESSAMSIDSPEGSNPPVLAAGPGDSQPAAPSSVAVLAAAALPNPVSSDYALPDGSGWHGGVLPAPPPPDFRIVFPPMVNPAPSDNYDDLWRHGVVFTPSAQMKSWPHGIYARDMAMALAIIGDTVAGDDRVASRFTLVFQGRPFKYATYQTQRAAWHKSTEEERRWIMERPRTREGLWTVCRKALSGWQQLPTNSYFTIPISRMMA